MEFAASTSQGTQCQGSALKDSMIIDQVEPRQTAVDASILPGADPWRLGHFSEDVRHGSVGVRTVGRGASLIALVLVLLNGGHVAGLGPGAVAEAMG